MSESQVKQVLARFESQLPLSDAEFSQLNQLLKDRPEQSAEIVDARAVNGLLHLLAVNQSGHEQFINECKSKFIASAERPIPTNVEPHPDHEIHLASFADVSDVVIQNRQKSVLSNNWKQLSTIAWLVVAASVLVLASTWSVVFLFTKGSSPEVVDNSPPSMSVPVKQGSSTPENSSKTKTQPLDSIGELARAGVPDPNETQMPDTLQDDGAQPGQTRIPEVQVESKSDSAALVAQPYPESPRLDFTTNSFAEFEPAAPVTPLFASVVSDKDAAWADELNDERIGIGEFQLVRGSAKIEFDNGISIRLLAPAEFNIVNDCSLKIANGSCIAEIPRKIDTYEISTPFGVFQNPANVRLQLNANPDHGIEALVTRGRVDYKSPGLNTDERKLELSKNGLFQTVVQPYDEQPVISPVVMARGKDKFTGRIGQGKNRAEFSSPAVFANVLTNIAERDDVNQAPDDLEKNWPLFVQELQALGPNAEGTDLQQLIEQFLRSKNFANPAKKLGDVFDEGTTNFQGSLSINGVQQQFDSREEYEKARRRLLNGSAFPSNFEMEKNQEQEFQGELNLNGHPLKFSSPEVFKLLRRKMIR